jgi:hypothetical protein
MDCLKHQLSTYHGIILQNTVVAQQFKHPLTFLGHYICIILTVDAQRNPTAQPENSDINLRENFNLMEHQGRTIPLFTLQYFVFQFVR